jgi:hypothetical protein
MTHHHYTDHAIVLHHEHDHTIDRVMYHDHEIDPPCDKPDCLSLTKTPIRPGYNVATRARRRK